MLTSTRSAERNIRGYLRGFSSPSVTEKTITLASSPTLNSAGQTRFPTFSMIRTSIVVERKLGEPRAHHVGVQVALAAEAGVGVDLHERDVEARQPVGVQGGLHVAFEDPEAEPVAQRSSVRSSSAVLPAPGELIMLTT